MNAEQVREILTRRWPDSEYLSIAEAPEESSRGGRKIDLLVVSLWPSRGLDIDAVEIKVSVSDWRRELKRAAKADFWWRHSHRFWVAAPADVAVKIRDEIPAGWGLLACEFDKPPVALMKPVPHDAEPLTWPQTVGLLRAAADAGVNALYRAEQRGYAKGLAVGEQQAERKSGEGYLRDRVTKLEGLVERFQEASGLDLRNDWEVDRVASLVGMVRAAHKNPEWVIHHLADPAERLASIAEALLKESRKAQEIVATIKENVAA